MYYYILLYIIIYLSYLYNIFDAWHTDILLEALSFCYAYFLLMRLYQHFSFFFRLDTLPAVFCLNFYVCNVLLISYEMFLVLNIFLFLRFSIYELRFVFIVRAVISLSIFLYRHFFEKFTTGPLASRYSITCIRILR